MNLDYGRSEGYAAALQIDQLADKIDGILKKLVMDIEDNVGNSTVWSGNAAQNFKNKWESVSDQFANFVSLLKEVKDKLELANIVTDTLDQQN